jgi:hypothetical protein
MADYIGSDAEFLTLAIILDKCSRDNGNCDYCPKQVRTRCVKTWDGLSEKALDRKLSAEDAGKFLLKLRKKTTGQLTLLGSICTNIQG